MFRRLTRGGDLGKVLAGIDAAQAAGLAVKINAVALKADNAAEIPALIQWAHGRGMDLTLIETMPLGEVEEDRTDQFLSLADVRAELESFWTLSELPLSTGGPARYVRVKETGGRLGFITPLSHTFCEACNRVRLTCTGVLHSCLGREDETDLRSALREEGPGALEAAIRQAVDAPSPRGTTSRSSAARRPPWRGTCRARGGEALRVLLFGRLADVAGWRERTIEAAPTRLSALTDLSGPKNDPNLGRGADGPSGVSGGGR